MIFSNLAVDAYNEWIMIDSTIITSHQYAADALKNIKTGMQEQRSYNLIIFIYQ